LIKQSLGAGLSGIPLRKIMQDPTDSIGFLLCAAQCQASDRLVPISEKGHGIVWICGSTPAVLKLL
jgi:hypothetical protein